MGDERGVGDGRPDHVRDLGFVRGLLDAGTLRGRMEACLEERTRLDVRHFDGAARGYVRAQHELSGFTVDSAPAIHGLTTQHLRQVLRHICGGVV